MSNKTPHSPVLGPRRVLPARPLPTVLSLLPYNTGKVRIGENFVPMHPVPMPDRDMYQLQTALLATTHKSVPVPRSTRLASFFSNFFFGAHHG